MKTNDKSQIAELAVAADLAKRGYTVSIPIGVAPYDLIVDRNGKLERIQVKYTAEKGPIVEAQLERSGNGIRTRYKADEFDWLAVYAPTLNVVYYVPINEVVGMKSFSIRTGPTKRNYPDNRINYAESYINI